jgi:hypothetical protein
MTTAPTGTTLGAIHMRLVYFQHHDTAEPVTPADLARVFHQLDLLVDYATRLITPKAAVVAYVQAKAKPHISIPKRTLEEAGESAEDLIARFAEELGVDLDAITIEEDPRQVGIDFTVVKARGGFVMTDLNDDDDDVTVTALRMGSPLEVLVEIPPSLWPFLALGLLALTERITTLPVRIARKRKEELLKSAILDRQTALVNDGRADVLAQLLIQEGPHRDERAPNEVLFLDPEDPEDELELASKPR